MKQIISFIYLAWYKYVLFIKVLYRPKRYKWKKKPKRIKYSDFNDAIYNLVGFGVFVLFFFLFTIIEIAFKIKGLIFLAKLRIPAFFLAVIGVIFFYLLRYLLFQLFPKLRLKYYEKNKLIRDAITQTKSIRFVYPLIFVIFLGLLFFFTTGLFIVSAVNN